MSMNQSLKAGSATLPSGTTVARYNKHEQAQAAVEKLSQSGFPVREVAIVGADLKMVEHVVGKITLGKVLLAGATQGAWLGLLLGIVASFMNPSNTGYGYSATLGLAVGIGIVGGIIFSFLSYFLGKDKREYLSHSHVVASCYEIVVAQNSGEARKTLANTPGNLLRAQTSRPRSNGDDPSSRPPRYGVRLSDTEKLSDAPKAEQSAVSTRTSPHGIPIPSRRSLHQEAPSAPQTEGENGSPNHGEAEKSNEKAPATESNDPMAKASTETENQD